MKGSLAAIVALTVCVLSANAHFYTPQRWGHMMHYNPQPQFMHRPMHYPMHRPMHYPMPQPMHYPMHFSMPFHDVQPQYPGHVGEPREQRLAETTFGRGLLSLALLGSGDPLGVTGGLLRAADLARGV